MESTGIVIKETIKNHYTNQEKNFESLVLKKLQYIKKYLVPSSEFSTPLCPPAFNFSDFAIQKL